MRTHSTVTTQCKTETDTNEAETSTPKANWASDMQACHCVLRALCSDSEHHSVSECGRIMQASAIGWAQWDVAPVFQLGTSATSKKAGPSAGVPEGASWQVRLRVPARCRPNPGGANPEHCKERPAAGPRAGRPALVVAWQHRRPTKAGRPRIGRSGSAAAGSPTRATNATNAAETDEQNTREQRCAAAGSSHVRHAAPTGGLTLAASDWMQFHTAMLACSASAYASASLSGENPAACSPSSGATQLHASSSTEVTGSLVGRPVGSPGTSAMLCSAAGASAAAAAAESCRGAAGLPVGTSERWA
jgi:hypothetical protein